MLYNHLQSFYSSKYPHPISRKQVIHMARKWSVHLDGATEKRFWLESRARRYHKRFVHVFNQARIDGPGARGAL
jgi:hypothetical protein